MHNGGIRHHTPGLRNRNTSVIFQTNGATPAVRLEQTVLFNETAHDRPLPVLARVGPLDDDNPPPLDGTLCHNNEVLPQLTGRRLMTFEVALK